MRPSRLIARILGLFLLATGLGLPGCGRSYDSSPRILPVPTQTAPAGQTFQLDLADYVVDSAGQQLTYSIVEGPGSFAGSVYTGDFESMGNYTVHFGVADPWSVSQSFFHVEVPQGNLAAVRVDSKSLRALDTDSEQFLLFSENHHVETAVASLSRGSLVFHRSTGGDLDLLVYDPYGRVLSTLGDSTRDERYVDHTSSDLVVFEVGPAGDRDVWIWNPRNGTATGIGIDDTLDERNAMIAGDDSVYFESAEQGSADIRVYDPASGQSTSVTGHPAHETLRAAQPDGGAVFGRPGSVAELDLFHFSSTTGVQEVGQDQLALDALDKDWEGVTSDGRVVFSATGSSSTNLYLWNPATARTTTITTTTSGEVNTFAVVSAGDIVVFTATDTANGGNDVFGYRVSDGSLLQANAGNATHVFEAVTTVSGEDAVVYTIPGGSTSIHSYNFTTATRWDGTAASYKFDAILGGGLVALTQMTGGGGAFVHDPTTGGVTTVVSGTGVPTFGAVGAQPGDFVFELEVSAQTDVFLWDASAAAVVTVSDLADDDAFQAVANTSGKVIFARTMAGNTNWDLFVWDPEGPATRQLTDIDDVGQRHDHTVELTWHGARD